MKNTATWVDSGFLIALFAKNDSRHQSAKAFLRDNAGLELHSLWAVIVETCYFLDNRGKQALLLWLERGAMVIHDFSTSDTANIRETIARYDNIDPDFTDAALVAMAGQSRIRCILTVDERGFSIYRFADGGAFERLWVDGD